MRSKIASIKRNWTFRGPFSMKNHQYRARLDFLRAGPKKAGGLTRNSQKPQVSSVSCFFYGPNSPNTSNTAEHLSKIESIGRNSKNDEKTARDLTGSPEKRREVLPGGQKRGGRSYRGASVKVMDFGIRVGVGPIKPVYRSAATVLSPQGPLCSSHKEHCSSHSTLCSSHKEHCALPTGGLCCSHRSSVVSPRSTVVLLHHPEASGQIFEMS